MPTIKFDIPCPTCHEPVPVDAIDRINREGKFKDTVTCACPNCGVGFDTTVELRVSLVRWRTTQKPSKP